MRPRRLPRADPYRIIAENTSQHEHWREGSFVDVLHESHRWDTDEYWKLECALYACSSSRTHALDADVFRIFSYVMLMFCCHFDSNDGFTIVDLDRDELYEFRERFQLVFEGYFRGSMPSPSIFDIPNPLLDT